MTDPRFRGLILPPKLEHGLSGNLLLLRGQMSALSYYAVAFLNHWTLFSPSILNSLKRSISLKGVEGSTLRILFNVGHASPLIRPKALCVAAFSASCNSEVLGL